MRSAKVPGNGRSVIVDAIHIESEDRLRQLAIGSADVQKRYELIDRPWRQAARPRLERAEGLVEVSSIVCQHAREMLAGREKRR